MTSSYRTAGALLALTIAAACKPPGPVNLAPGPDGIVAARRNNAASISPDLADRVRLERSAARETATGTIEVSFVLQNATDEPLQVESRVRFLDDTDAEAEAPSAWQRTHLSPNSFATVVERSTGVASSAHYFIEIR